MHCLYRLNPMLGMCNVLAHVLVIDNQLSLMNKHGVRSGRACRSLNPLIPRKEEDKD